MHARRHIAGTLLALALPPAATAASQEYLDAIMADYAEFATGHFEAGDRLAAWTGTASDASDGTASLEAFGEFVKRQFRGTYILYARLPESQRRAIWQEYLKTGDLGGIRSNIYAARRNGRANETRRSTLTNLPLDF